MLFPVSTALTVRFNLVDSTGVPITTATSGATTVQYANPSQSTLQTDGTKTGFAHLGNGIYQSTFGSGLVGGTAGMFIFTVNFSGALQYSGAVELIPYSLANLDVASSTLATAANLTTAQADLTTLTGRLTSTRAGFLDRLDAAISTVATAASLATAQADLTTLTGRLTSGRATKLDNLDVASSTLATAANLSTAQNGITSVDNKLTTARAGYLDNVQYYTQARATKIDFLDSYISSVGGAAGISAIQTDVTTLLSRLTSIRAGLLDHLNADITSRATQSSMDVTQGFANSVDGKLTSTRAGYLDTLAGFVANARIANLDYLDASISSRSADNGGIDTLLNQMLVLTSQTADLWDRLTLARANYLDNLPYLDVALSTRATAASLATAQSDLTTLTGRLTSTRAGYLDTALSTLATAANLASAQSGIASVDGKLTTARAGYLDNLQPLNGTRVAKLDHLDADVSTRSTQSSVDNIAIQGGSTRLAVAAVAIRNTALQLRTFLQSGGIMDNTATQATMTIYNEDGTVKITTQTDANPDSVGAFGFSISNHGLAENTNYLAVVTINSPSGNVTTGHIFTTV